MTIQCIRNMLYIATTQRTGMYLLVQFEHQQRLKMTVDEKGWREFSFRYSNNRNFHRGKFKVCVVNVGKFFVFSFTKCSKNVLLSIIDNKNIKRRFNCNPFQLEVMWIYDKFEYFMVLMSQETMWSHRDVRWWQI